MENMKDEWLTQEPGSKCLFLSQIFWLADKEMRKRSSDTDCDSFHNNKQTRIILITPPKIS